MWKSNQLHRALAVLASFLAVIWLFIRFVLCDDMPESVALLPGDGDVIEPGQPLCCRVVLARPADVRARLRDDKWFQDQLRARPELATPRLYRNPLVANAVLVGAEVENISGRDFSVYLVWHEPLQVYVELKDAAGKDVVFPDPACSLKRLIGPLPVDAESPFVTLAPNQVNRYGVKLFEQLGNGSVILPGQYTGTIICQYARAPNAQESVVRSRPFTVTITTQNIKEFHDLLSGSMVPKDTVDWLP